MAGSAPSGEVNDRAIIEAATENIKIKFIIFTAKFTLKCIRRFVCFFAMSIGANVKNKRSAKKSKRNIAKKYARKRAFMFVFYRFQLLLNGHFF